MQYKKIGGKILFRLDKGEEIVDSLKKICEEFGVTLGTVSGIGATDRATIGLFETATKKYLSRELEGDMEICPLYGNISTMGRQLYLHLHINLADKDQRSFGGHLTGAQVSATFEGVIDIMDDAIDRKFSDEIGLNLMDI